MADTTHGFPSADYTPHGYLDNPAHCRVLNMSGVIRSYPAIGMGWWYPTGRFDDGDNAGTEYVSLLRLGFRIGDLTLVTPEDFASAGVDLVSRYHSKNVMSFDFEAAGIRISARYVLLHEHFLGCVVTVENLTDSAAGVTAFPSHTYKTVVRRWWGADGLAGYYVPEKDTVVQTGWAYADVFAMRADIPSSAHDFAYSEAEWAGKCAEGLAGAKGGSVRRRDPLYGMLAYAMEVPANGSASLTIGLARGVNRDWTLRTLDEGLPRVAGVLEERYTEDDRFYSACPILTGDWPDHWKHGWVYDWETQRMCSRPPVGIYKHRWDAMLIHEPRVVLGETGIDSMCLSYADPELAKEELYGVFADSPGPQVPCSREDGSMNMIAADGSECGTAPSWCFPFHVIHSVYCRYPDNEWLAKIYPYLVAYIEWWFANRTDSEGWFHCKCSWESGQDGSKRFLIQGDSPGNVSDYVRTVDVEASVAEAVRNLATYARILGLNDDEERWRELAAYRTERTREMFLDGWFRDVDVRTGEPIILPDYYDIMMLAPVTCGVATDEQTRAIAPMMEYFVSHPRFWLDWPSFVFPFTEAAWNAGRHQLISDALFTVADRVYSRLDVRDVVWLDRETMHNRIPGVSYEFWPCDDRIPGGGSENYGWGATMPINIIRGIFGFHESSDPGVSGFVLTPTIPTALLTPGRSYGITRLRYRGLEFDLMCTVGDGGTLDVELDFRSESGVTLHAGAASASGTSGKLGFAVPNGGRVEFSVEQRAR